MGIPGYGWRGDGLHRLCGIWCMGSYSKIRSQLLAGAGRPCSDLFDPEWLGSVAHQTEY